MPAPLAGLVLPALLLGGPGLVLLFLALHTATGAAAWAIVKRQLGTWGIPRLFQRRGP